MIDYRDLLLRYVELVTGEEGTSFLHADDGAPLFNEAEWAELQTIRDEAYAATETRAAERLAKWKVEEPQRQAESGRAEAAERARRSVIAVIK